ncbi:hypothetical protein ACEWY4_001865 [Coilia grayii]|uniref:Pleckstrin homology domain-containing protein n=1 Tax=Coilia grayii TaxID=363190 RepID=A0ABD1KU54_9TELE
MRDDTMWQLYEWQQRQVMSQRQAYATLPSPRIMADIAEHAAAAAVAAAAAAATTPGARGSIAPSVPPSPLHGSLGGGIYHTYSPRRSARNYAAHSEVSSPTYRGDLTIDRRHRAHPNKYGYPLDRRSVAMGAPVQSITPQSLQGKTMGTEDYRDGSHTYRPEELDVDAKLSRLCEQDKVVRTQEDKLQQLHREKHTLETALLSASQEIEMSGENPAAMQSVIQQRDVLQSGLLSTCRELTRVTTELERAWREYDRLEADVTTAKANLLERLEALGSPQTEPPSQQHVKIQKELWRIQDVMEALSKNKPKRSVDTSFQGTKPVTSVHKSEERPRSAVEQGGVGGAASEGVRPRMSVEEQMERIRRHQQATLRRRESAGGQEGSLSRSSSFSRDQIATNPYYTLQSSKRSDAVSPDRQRLEASLQALEQEMLERASAMQIHLPGREPQPKLTAEEEVQPSDEYRQCSPKAEEERKEEEEEEEEKLKQEKDKEDEEDKQEADAKEEESEEESWKREEQIIMLASQNSLQTAVLVRVGTEEDEEEEEEEEEEQMVEEEEEKQEMKNNEEPEPTFEKPRQDVEAEQGTIINCSYELPDETSKHSQVVSVNNLSTPPQSPASTPTQSSPSPPQVTDGSHFMCV